MNSLHPLRVLLVTKGLGLGGAERVMIETAIALRDVSCEFSVLNIDSSRDDLREKAEASGISVISVPMRAAFLPGKILRLRRWIKGKGIDILHAHLPIAGVYGRILGLLSDVPVVYTEHSLVTQYKPVTKLLARVSYGLNAATIAVSDAVRDSVEAEYGGRAARKCHVIRNGIDLHAIEYAAAQGQDVRDELGIAADTFVVGTVASFRRVKRLDLLIRAFARLRSGRAAVLLIVGYGDMLPELKRVAERAGVSDRVIFTGMRRDRLRFVRRMDLFVICSDWEGLPVALLEAMALARPIVATRVGGIPELVIDGATGRLVPPSDEVSLAVAIEEMSFDLGLARRLGEAAKDLIAEHAGLREMSLAIRSVYELAVRSSRRKETI